MNSTDDLPRAARPFRHSALVLAAFGFGLALAGPLMAQETEAPAADAAQATDPEAPGTPYVREVFGAWSMRCVHTEDGRDPCQMQQALTDANGNTVSEVSLFDLPEGNAAAAGGTIATPLDTLLTEQITVRVDEKPGRRYPFSFCSPQGCFARIGLLSEELDELRRGKAATITIAPLAAPDQLVTVTMSLDGFTAAYDAVAEANAANRD